MTFQKHEEGAPVKKFLLYVGAIYYPSPGPSGDFVGSADTLEEVKEALPAILEAEGSYYWWEIADHETFATIEDGGKAS